MSWICTGGGGIDTVRWKNTKTGEHLCIPGIRQIWHNGKLRINWWLRYALYLIEIKPNHPSNKERDDE